MLKDQLDSPSVIMSLILMTSLFYKALILHREMSCSTLLGPVVPLGDFEQ